MPGISWPAGKRLASQAILCSLKAVSIQFTLLRAHGILFLGTPAVVTSRLPHARLIHFLKRDRIYELRKELPTLCTNIRNFNFRNCSDLLPGLNNLHGWDLRPFLGDVTQGTVAIPYRCFGITCLSMFKGKKNPRRKTLVTILGCFRIPHFVQLLYFAVSYNITTMVTLIACL